MPSKLQKKRWRRVGIAFLLVVGLWLGMCFGLARMYIGHQSSTGKSLTNVANLDSVEIPAATYSIPAFASKALIDDQFVGNTVFICVHGYGGSPAAWEPLVARMNTPEFGFVVPWMAGHGANPRPNVTFGAEESREVEACIRWVQSRTRKEQPKIVLVGVSLGAATCWHVAASMGSTVDAVVSEASFSDFEQTQDRWFNLMFPGARTVLAPVPFFAEKMMNGDVAKLRPYEDALTRRGFPDLIFHDEKDLLMPRSNAEALSEASGRPIWDIPGAKHAAGLGVAADEYARRLRELAHQLQ